MQQIMTIKIMNIMAATPPTIPPIIPPTGTLLQLLPLLPNAKYTQVEVDILIV